MCPGAAPLWEQVAIVTLIPPVGTSLWWLRARGWARTVQGETVTEKTKQRQEWEFWALLAASYVMMICVFIYASWKCKG